MPSFLLLYRGDARWSRTMPDAERDLIWERWGAWLVMLSVAVVEPGLQFGVVVELGVYHVYQEAPPLVA